MGLLPAKAIHNTMPLARDLLHPSAEEEKRRSKVKRLVQHPNSYFMDVKCPGCRCLCWMCNSSLPTNWWQGKTDRWMFIQKETELMSLAAKVFGIGIHVIFLH